MRSKFYYSDKLIFVSVLVLVILSNLMIYSTWSIRSVVFGDSSSFAIISKQLFFTLLSAGIYVFSSGLSTKFYRKIAKQLLAVCGVLLILVFAFPPINESHSWIPLGFVNFQPAELTKVAVILCLASIYSDLHEKKMINSVKHALWFPLFIIIIPTLAIIIQPDPGSAMIVLLVGVVVIFGAKIPKKTMNKIIKKALLYMLVIATVITLINVLSGGAIYKYVEKSQSRALSRLDYKDPCGNYDGTGFHVCNSLIAINTGGILGKGLGNSTQKYLYLPETHTDAIIAVTAEELGILGVSIIMLCYLILIFRTMYIASKAPTMFGSMICLGIAFLFFLHVFINIGGITGLIPFTGVPLPFFSYGGTFFMISAGAVGIVQTVAISIKREL